MDKERNKTRIVVLTAAELTDRVRLVFSALNESMESGVDIDKVQSAQSVTENKWTCKGGVFPLHMRGQERTKVKVLVQSLVLYIALLSTYTTQLSLPAVEMSTTRLFKIH